MATHYSILAWKIPWTEELGGLQSMVSQRVGGTGLKDEGGKHAVFRHFLSFCFVRRAYTGATCWTTGVKFANQPVCRWGSLLAWRWLACSTATCLVSREPHMTTDTLGLSETSLEPGVLNLSNIDIEGLDHSLLWGPPCAV